eukprot:6292582-Prymnesium_polylepis.2
MRLRVQPGSPGEPGLATSSTPLQLYGSTPRPQPLRFVRAARNYKQNAHLLLPRTDRRTDATTAIHAL